ncbi:hypothetical protein C0033_17030 [Clostridium sp. chh4-2]|uniref:hypothetical protein n=1 Tax=Clostridium sp. chh4-2 TaxID=2067550 RepID=UPI000CCE4428|nr:hypothetical protein [Clostridium sp. chh4-2]PNV60893.1 hypothetical protein C0033_17030 [Clostridium sp. chh4-2]
MSGLYCGNSGVFLVFGNVSVRKVYCDGQKLILDVLYADREEQRITYSGLWYSAFHPWDQGAVVSTAERLPVKCLREPRHRPAMEHMIEDGVDDPEKLLTEAEAAGCRLFLHYVGETDEYAVLAREVDMDAGS